jgi:hypothetical protein
MKILRFTDDTPNIRKFIDECKIFIALVRSHGFHAGFFTEVPSPGLSGML